MKRKNRRINWSFISRIKTPLFSFVLLVPGILLAQNKQADAISDNEDQLLSQYIQSKETSFISFDASNIKQFWTETAVISQKTSFDIIMLTKSHESIPFKIQLVNVNEVQDCKVEVFAETADYSFSVLDKNSKVLSTSQPQDKFLSYSVASAVFHLEDTPRMSFMLKFASKTMDVLAIKKIVLSFTNNKESSFLMPPGTISITKDNVSLFSAQQAMNDLNSLSITGKKMTILCSKKILVSDQEISSNVTIKNTGANPTRVSIGYRVYDQDNNLLDARCYPYKGINKILTVVSSEEMSNKIVVDQYTDWQKDTFLALNAKEDLSDIPNANLADGRIVEIKKLENGHAEITLGKPLKNALKKGSKVRVHGLTGTMFYSAVTILQPGQEETFSSTIKKDDNYYEFSSRAFSRGVHYVIPQILSYSINPEKDNTLSISDYSISY